MDWSKYLNKVLAIDPEKKLARVQPGTVLDVLRLEAEKHHLTFAPDPSTHTHNTLGGMIGNNSCGVHSLMGLGTGRTSDQVHELEILLYDGTRMTVGATPENELERIIAAGSRQGEIYARLRDLRDRYADEIRRRYPTNLPRRVSGYNLDDLLPERGFHVARALSGTEGTCVTMLEASLHLVHSPAVKSVLVLGYPDVYAAGDHVPEILEFKPTGLEGLDDVLVRDMKKKNIHPQDITLLPRGGGWLLVEFGGESKEEADDKAHRLMDHLKSVANPPSMKLFDDEAEEEHLWKVRESGLGATARIPGEKDAWEGWEDSAVPPDQVGDYLRDLRKLLTKYGYGCSLYGHFGQGCIHTRIDFDLKTVAGSRALPRIPERGWRPGRRVWRFDLGRARRRPVQGGTLAQDVRCGPGSCLRRVQGDLGSRQCDEPAQGGGPLLARRKSPAGTALPPAPARDAFPVSGRQRQLLLRDGCAVSASANAARNRMAPCAPATW